MTTTSPVKDQEKLRELKSLREKTSKKYVLIDFMLNTGLRVSDVLSTMAGTVLHREYIGIEKKTKKTKRFKLNAGIQLIHYKKLCFSQSLNRRRLTLSE